MAESQPIPCDECQQRLEEFALDELEGNVRDAVARHLRDGCSVCNARLAQIVTDFAALAQTLPVKTPPQQIEHKLLQRIDTKSLPRPSNWPRNLIAAAAALAAVLAGIAAWISWQDVPTTNGPDNWVELRRRVDEANRIQPFADVPQLNFVSLRGPAPEQPIHGYVVTDNRSRQWHVYIFNLPPLPADRTYQLWFATPDNRPISAGTATSDAKGTISTIIDLPSDVPVITGLAISDEPLTGSPTPTGEHIYQANLP